MKKCCCIFVLFAMFISIATTPVRSAETAYAFTDTNVTVITPVAFEELFEASYIDSVSYNYEMTTPAEGDEDSQVSVLMELLIGNNKHIIALQGTVGRYALPSGNAFWEGSIEGALTIEDDQYMVIAGFAKLESSEAPSLTVTIQGGNGQLVAFFFGEDQINEEVQQLIIPNIPSSSSLDISDEIEVNSSFAGPGASVLSFGDDIKPTLPPSEGSLDLGPNYEWDYEGASFTNFSFPSDGGTALRSRAYFYQDMNQLAITTKSYCDNVSACWNENPTWTVQHTSISEFSVTLDMDMGNMNGANGAYIGGIMAYDFAETDYGKAGRALKPLFEELMSDWDYGSAIISALLDTLTGTVDTTISESAYADTASVEVSFGLLDYANFDNSSAGVPLVFVLTRSSASYVGSSPMAATKTMKYRTYYYDHSVGQYLYIYSVAEPAVIELVLDLG